MEHGRASSLSVFRWQVAPTQRQLVTVFTCQTWPNPHRRRTPSPHPVKTHCTQEFHHGKVDSRDRAGFWLPAPVPWTRQCPTRLISVTGLVEPGVVLSCILSGLVQSVCMDRSICLPHRHLARARVLHGHRGQGHPVHIPPPQTTCRVWITPSVHCTATPREPGIGSSDVRFAFLRSRLHRCPQPIDPPRASSSADIKYCRSEWHGRGEQDTTPSYPSSSNYFKARTPCRPRR